MRLIEQVIEVMSDVRGDVHTNTIEGFWSHLKAGTDTRQPQAPYEILQGVSISIQPPRPNRLSTV